MLQALERAEKNVDYLALDLSYSELQRTLAAIPVGTYKHVRCYGLHGTYDDGLEWLKRPENAGKPKCILWLGSSIGNLKRKDAATFLRGFEDILCWGDSMLIGVDGCQQADRVYHAYNDREGKTHEFVLNGLVHANKLFGKEVFHLPDWKVVGQYNQEQGRHEAFYTPVRDVSVDGVHIKCGELVRVEESYKYSSDQVKELWKSAGLVEVGQYGNASDEYRTSPLTKYVSEEFGGPKSNTASHKPQDFLRFPFLFHLLLVHPSCSLPSSWFRSTVCR